MSMTVITLQFVPLYGSRWAPEYGGHWGQGHWAFLRNSPRCILTQVPVPETTLGTVLAKRHFCDMRDGYQAFEVQNNETTKFSLIR